MVLKKEYSDASKLRYVKQYTTGDANDLVKNYHLGQELPTVLKVLDETYGKSDMVIRESLKNIRKLPTVANEKNVKANKNLIAQLNTILSTLKVYNYETENEVENSTFLIDMEAKVPYNTYIEWEKQKVILKSNNETISLQKFIDFYTETVSRDENAQYLRQDDRPKPSASYSRPAHKHATVLSVRATKADKNRTNANSWCIWCEEKGHNTRFCSSNHSEKHKYDKCMKNNSCFMCFQSTDHKARSCPYRIKCMLCDQVHHFNNHSRKDITAYYEKKKKNEQKQ